MSDDGASGAAAPAAANAYVYIPPEPLRPLVQHHRQQHAALHNARNWLQRERKRVQDCKSEAKHEARFAAIVPAVLSELSAECTRDEMVFMTKCEKAIADLGGIEEAEKLIKLCKDANDRMANAKTTEAEASAKSSDRVETNRKYRAFLKSKDLKQGRTYKVKWTNLVDFHSKLPLPETHSFVVLLPDCQTKTQNPAADPAMLHLRLPFVIFNEVNELYIDYTEGMMELVTDDNAESMCATVFDNKNVQLLYAADGGGQQGYNDYKTKLVHDSLHAIAGRLDYRPTPEQMASFTGTSSSRSRGSVDYRERRNYKRARPGPSAEVGTSIPAAPGDEDGDAERFAAGVLLDM